MPIAETLRPIMSWLSEDELSSLYSATYWNDLEGEKEKVWWIEGGPATYERLRKYLDESGLMAEYRVAEDAIRKLGGSSLVVADLAAGIGWSAALLSRLPNVGSVRAVDISTHRFERLFPRAVDMFDGQAAKLDRHIGSFYALGFETGSIDVVFLSQAFHHASDPRRLVEEIDRVLKPGGSVVMIGERCVTMPEIAKRMVRILLKERRYSSDFSDLFPPDNETGDHYYRRSDYSRFLQPAGYRVRWLSVPNIRNAVIVAAKGDR